MKNYFLGFVALLTFLFLGYHFWTAVNFDNINIKYVKIAEQNIKVELAVTSVEQSRGLSGRRELAKETGMLFVFDTLEKHSFWMKDMNFPIDIIWLSEEMKVVFIKKNALPELYPESYGPNENAKYVLEVVSGFSDTNNLKVGDSVSVAVYEY